MPDDPDFRLTPVDFDPFDLSEQADLSHTLGEGLVQVDEPLLMLFEPSVRIRKYRISEPESPRYGPRIGPVTDVNLPRGVRRQGVS
jgi:hypothetical protein